MMMAGVSTFIRAFIEAPPRGFLLRWRTLHSRRADVVRYAPKACICPSPGHLPRQKRPAVPPPPDGGYREPPGRHARQAVHRTKPKVQHGVDSPANWRLGRRTRATVTPPE